jgi:hypothetical protein
MYKQQGSLSSIPLKMTSFWDIAPWSLVEVYQCFRGAYYFHHQGVIVKLMMDAECTAEALGYFYET